MNKIIGMVIGIIISLSLIVVVLSMSEDILYEYSEIPIEEEYIAIKTTSQSEYLELSNEYIDIIYISVNTVNLDLESDILFAFSDEDTIVLVVGASDVGDDIVINYTYLTYGYNEDYSVSTINMVELLPTLLILTILSSVVILVMKKPKA